MKSIISSIVILSLAFLSSCSKNETTVSPTFIPSRGGLPNSTIIIKGMNFSTNPGANYVEFTGGLPGTVTSATSTELAVTVPTYASSGPITVVVNNSAHGTTATFNVLKGVVSTFSSGTYVEHLAVDPQGNLYGENSSTNSGSFVIKFNQQGVASTFVGGYYGKPFFGPLWGLACDESGNIFCNVFWSVSKVTQSLAATTLAGSVNNPGYSDGTGDQARFTYLAGITVGADNNIYVCDQPKIRKITQSGVVTTVAGLTTAGNTDGDISVATFSQPEGIALDGSGNIFISDTYNFNIRRIATNGLVTTFAGSTNRQYGHVDGAGTSARFYYPQAMAIDEAGNIFISDSDYVTNNNFYIRMINASGYVTTILGGAKGTTDGPMETAACNGPDGIVFDADGNLYFADTNNNSVRKITFQAK